MKFKKTTKFVVLEKFPLYGSLTMTNDDGDIVKMYMQWHG